ncbi:zinc finger protein-domain-containing protein [Aspergillus pseudoustus]|uniref:Zinc finger protein-domain-containing protein n=1 Tax=Aspergillus pseudoustus TaxID=1810923 RepID=A0ABR4ILH0_9EURO
MDQAQLRRIGAGFCGTVWATSERGSAFKREDGGPHRSLLHDFRTHQHIQHCVHQRSDLEGTGYSISIPLCYGFIKPTDDWGIENLARFPKGYEPCNTIHMQRIPPMPEATRRLLTERYCPSSLISEILNSDTNRDCLIRPYLGRRRIPTASASSRFKAFSLRNYPLHVDQMEEIGVPENDILGYARTMAKTLAQLHWIAQVDGNDVEFVLASPNEELTGTRKSSQPWSNILGSHEMWILDFDLAREMTMDEEGIQQAANAFTKNDPYYPRPDGGSPLWIAFREQYLVTSRDCLQSHANKTLTQLPLNFIHLVEKLNEANDH